MTDQRAPVRDHAPSAAVRAIAFYLPQFHPVPENDEWWGPGFTEWTNVARARPLFRGHYQPHLPADLGFYDLRLPEAREAQAALARQYGVHGFCYYHYWFRGRRLLDRPFSEVLRSGEPDLPFCLCWANENWTRSWDGLERQVLVEQTYSEEDDRRHVAWLAEAFADPRYIRVHGRPVLLVYRASRLPDAARTTDVWRHEAQRLGIGDLYLCRVESSPEEHGDPAGLGFDAAVEFQPDWRSLSHPPGQGELARLATRVRRRLRAPRHRVVDYSSLVAVMERRPEPGYLRYPCVAPSWDNTPRRQRGGVVLASSSPEVYGMWLAATVKSVVARPAEDRIVFVNAWNEWGEGCHLEPCQRWGRRYLEATLRALSETPVPVS